MGYRYSNLHELHRVPADFPAVPARLIKTSDNIFGITRELYVAHGDWNGISNVDNPILIAETGLEDLYNHVQLWTVLLRTTFIL